MHRHFHNEWKSSGADLTSSIEIVQGSLSKLVKLL